MSDGACVGCGSLSPSVHFAGCWMTESVVEPPIGVGLTGGSECRPTMREAMEQPMPREPCAVGLCDGDCPDGCDGGPS